MGTNETKGHRDDAHREEKSPNGFKSLPMYLGVPHTCIKAYAPTPSRVPANIATRQSPILPHLAHRAICRLFIREVAAPFPGCPKESVVLLLVGGLVARVDTESGSDSYDLVSSYA